MCIPLINLCNKISFHFPDIKLFVEDLLYNPECVWGVEQGKGVQRELGYLISQVIPGTDIISAQ